MVVESLLRTLSIRGNIPKLKVLFVLRVEGSPLSGKAQARPLKPRAGRGAGDGAHTHAHRGGGLQCLMRMYMK